MNAADGNIAQVAKELGIYDSTLGNWVRQARAEQAGGPMVEERAEIRELRRELERTRRERDILAKAFMPAGGRAPVGDVIVGGCL